MERESCVKTRCTVSLAASQRHDLVYAPRPKWGCSSPLSAFMGCLSLGCFSRVGFPDFSGLGFGASDREHGASAGPWDLGQTIGNNFHNRPQRHLGIERGHVARFHANAAITGRPANQPLLRRPVNINTAAEGVRVGCLKATQPNDPRDDGVPAGRIRLDNLSGKAAIMKDRPDRRVIADFLRDLQDAEGVVMRPQLSPSPNLEVETGYVASFAPFPISMSF